MRWKAILQVSVIAGVAAGQQTTDSRVKVLTVCEVLGDVNRYADDAVAIVGQLERSVSLIDHNEYLSQAKCEHPMVTHGHKWSNKIQILAYWEEGMPRPPDNSPKLDDAVVAAKLSVIRKTTKLGVHQEPRFKGEGQSIAYSHLAIVSNEWGVAYGRIVKSPRLDEDCGSDGCGGDDVPLILIVNERQVHALGADHAQPHK